MNILKDYIAYARSYVNPKLSEEAAQYLIQAYVGKKSGSLAAVWLIIDGTVLLIFWELVMLLCFIVFLQMNSDLT